MNMKRAIEILGINRTKTGDLTPMIRALSMMSVLNTPEQNERLEAAQFVTRRWAAYQAECNAARDLKFKRKSA